MLTEDELAALESLLARARAAAGQARSESGGTVNVGDLVQLRPGADSHWQTSLLLVCKVRDNGHISGIVLRPHRSGYRDAWYTYSVPEVLRIGRAPFPPPESTVNSAGYLAICPKCLGRDGDAPPASLAEGQQDVGEIQLGPRLWWACSDGQQDGGEIAIGPRLWWVVSEPKPKEIRGKKPAIAEAQQTLKEIQQAIEELPKQDDGALPEPKPKPIQREIRGQKQPVIVHQLEQVRQLVLDAVASPYTKSQYAHSLDEFFRWWEEQGRPARATVQSYRAHLEARGLAPSTITHQLPAVRKLAKLAANAGLLEPAAQGQKRKPALAEVQQQAHDCSTWLTKQQAAEVCGVHARTIGRWAESKLIRAAKLKRPQPGPRVPVYHPGDVERMAQEFASSRSAAVEPKPKPIQRETHAARIRKILSGGAKPA